MWNRKIKHLLKMKQQFGFKNNYFKNNTISYI